MTTPNMGLDLPSVGVTAGPAWASLIVAALETLDSHDHSTGSGVAITPAGLNINDDLSFGSHNATALRSVRLSDQTVKLPNADDLRALYSKNGELCYLDAAGNEVVITASGAVAGATGTITGLTSPASASYSSVTKALSVYQDTNKLSKFNISDVSFYEFDSAVANAITIKSPASVAAAYSITLPLAVPAFTYPVTMTGAGVLAASGSILLADGTNAAPSISFAADTNTGFYRAGADSIGFATNGIARATFNGEGFNTANGSGSLPSYAFLNDPDTGLYREAANQIGISTGGTARVLVTNNGIEMAADGSAASPAITWNGDEDTGFWRTGANQIGVSVGGVNRLTVTNAGLAIGDDLTVAGNAAVTGSLNIASGGAFKVKTFTGSLTAGSTVTLSVSGTILGGFAFGSLLSKVVGDAAGSLRWISGSGGQPRLNNDDISTQTYHAVFFYS